MCAQFPMLSAPGPPDGSSPTPVPPDLPMVIETPQPPSTGLVDRQGVAGSAQLFVSHDAVYPMSVPLDGAGVWRGGVASSRSSGLVNPGTKKINIGEL